MFCIRFIYNWWVKSSRIWYRMAVWSLLLWRSRCQFVRNKESVMQNMLLCKPCGQYTNAQHFLQDTVWLQVYQNCNRLLQLLTPSGLDSSALYHRLHCQHLNLTTLVSVNFRHILTSKLYHGCRPVPVVDSESNNFPCSVHGSLQESASTSYICSIQMPLLESWWHSHLQTKQSQNHESTCHISDGELINCAFITNFLYTCYCFHSDFTSCLWL